MAAGHDGQRQGALRRHQGLLGNRPTQDLKTITIPTLVLHGEDDQIVRIAASALKAIELLQDGMLKTYPGFSHGMLTVNADLLNADLLEFMTR